MFLFADTIKSKYSGDIEKDVLNNLSELETPVSPENEDKIWSFLETRASLLLRSNPTSAEVMYSEI